MGQRFLFKTPGPNIIGLQYMYLRYIFNRTDYMLNSISHLVFVSAL
jgi:hypothetical protein